MRSKSLSLGLIRASMFVLLSHVPTQGQTPTTSHMLVWWDAARIQETRAEAGLPELSGDDALNVWPDVSGAGRDGVQRDERHQPKLVRIGDDWVVRFDGESDHLRSVDVPTAADALTVFLVVAPHENAGGFRGFLCAGATDGRDYETGFNIDMGPGPTARFEQLNVEGRGFGGARDLLDAGFPFGTLRVVECVVDPHRRSVECLLDGKPSGSRAWEPGQMALQHLTLGSRFYTNGPGAQQVRGSFKGDVAEVILYDRVLSDEDRAEVRGYLTEKHARLADLLPQQLDIPGHSTPLVKAENPPLVQMLVPGFRVRELPVELTNVNNVRYRADGTLVTLGYNGDLHLLSDTDGDGLEDRAEAFWRNNGSLRGPIGMHLTPPGYDRGRGAFVPSKGKVSLIVDTDGDDVADREVVVASGWQEIPQNVDAVGIAMDKDGALYFGLGTANYANAYLIDENGTAAYELSGDRGTVQRISPDFSRRDVVCTGVRFPIGFAFDRHGELFCTDQEGATWLANGNPFDELLHIQSGRHYGFPPRHPRHNPDVIDEPSTYEYGPQHQSTCGMIFNEPVGGGPVFGPVDWRGDAIVCGESRGKLWRTRLVATNHGYVADAQLLACLQMLTVDACVAPDGDLVVACHSGPPDWGTGPTGAGKLFRIEMSDADAPRPVATWAQSPHEIRIAFDRPLDPLMLRNADEGTRVEHGEFVRAGDRFENLAPPYAVVQQQALAPRFPLPVAGVSVTSDQRTVIVSTAAMSAHHHYAVTLPVQQTALHSGTTPSDQHPQIDVDLSPTGLEVEFQADDGNASWSGWLPHFDLNVARELTRGSQQHDVLWDQLRLSGRIEFKTLLDLQHILRPRVQAGSTIDYEWPAEEVTVALTSSVPFDVEARGAAVEHAEGRHEARFTTSGDNPEPVEVAVRLSCPGGQLPALSIAVFTSEDVRLRPMPLRRFLLPWVREAGAPAPALSRSAELLGGNWGRGRRVFRSEAAGCAKCHAIRGEGATIGPDLANLIHRDYASVLRDIQEPSFAINPDYIGQTVLLKDGRVMTGVLLTQDDHLLLGNEKGEMTRLTPDEIESLRLAGISTMPKGLTEKLSEGQVLDLMTYLLTPPPSMPLDGPLTAPPVRTGAEVAALLAGAVELPETLRPLHVTLVSGPKDHGPGEHDYPAWQVQWRQLLAAAEGIDVDIAWEFPSDEQLDTADVLIFFQKGAWDDERAAKLDAYQRRGGGAVFIHWAVNGDERADEFAERIGLASGGGGIRFRHGPLTLDMHNTDHPIMRNLGALQLYDESYWLLSGAPEDITLLATSTEDGQPRPQVWTYQRGEGRVFVSIPGHYSWTFDDPLFRALLLRGIAWTAREPVDRFNELVPLGARMTR